MDVNFDMDALGKILGKCQQNKANEEKVPEITMSNIQQALSAAEANIGDMTISEVAELTELSLKFVQQLNELVIILNKLERKYKWNLDKYTD